MMSESTVKPQRFDLRAYVAGGGATAALVASALVGFLALVALVAFNGLPFIQGDEGDALPIAEPAGGAPEAAAIAVGAGAPEAVAASPAADAPVAQGAQTASVSPPAAAASTPTGAPPGSPPASPTPPSEPAPPASPNGGTLGGTVGDLEGATGRLGLDLPLSELTEPVTRPLDRVLNDTLDGLGRRTGTDLRILP